MNDNGTIILGDKVTSVIVLFLLLVSSLNDSKQGGGLAIQFTPSASTPGGIDIFPTQAIV